MKNLGLSFLLLACFAISNGIGNSGGTAIPSDCNIEVTLELKQGITTDDHSEVDGIITIRNNGKKTVIVQSPSNRLVVAFVVLNERGNVIQPIGKAKVDPRFQEKTFEPNSQFSEEFKGLKFITGTAQFGYDLKKGERYRVVAIYRPWGPGEVGICSKEISIGLK